MNVKMICQTLDKVCDAMLAQLGLPDERDSALICHWQDGTNPGFRVSLIRKSDGKTLTRFIDCNGDESP